MACQPKLCCCCCNVRIGTLVLGKITLILFGIDLVAVIGISILKFGDIRESCEELPQSHDPNGLDPGLAQRCFDIIISVLATSGVLCLAVVIVSILLLLGIQKVRPGFMIPYLVGQVFGILIFGAASLSLVILAIFKLGIVGIILVLLFFGFVTGLQIYLLLIVRACYREVRREMLNLARIPDSAEGIMLQKM